MTLPPSVECCCLTVRGEASYTGSWMMLTAHLFCLADMKPSVGLCMQISLYLSFLRPLTLTVEKLTGVCRAPTDARVYVRARGCERMCLCVLRCGSFPMSLFIPVNLKRVGGRAVAAALT